MANIYEVHAMALDGLVSMNSLFSGVVFIGLALTVPGQHSLENPGACDANIKVVESLLVYEVISFCFFLLSSMVAHGLKLSISLLKSKDEEAAETYINNPKSVRVGMLVSAVGTVLGCIFLVLAISSLAQIKLGVVSCGSKPTTGIIAAITIMVPSALVFYLGSVIYAFFQK